MKAAKKKIKPSPVLLNPGKVRDDQRCNQKDFWNRYGVTQSGGSRYENMRRIPLPTSMLMVLHETGVVTDEQLAAAQAIVQASRG